jgi:hypothetical protein
LERCGDWLTSSYGGQWTSFEIERCFDILLTLCEVEFDWDTDIFYHPEYRQCGISYQPKNDVLKKILEKPGVSICSYKGAQYTEAHAEKLFGKDGIGSPVMLIKIIRDDVEYEKFCRFWKSKPTLSKIFELLKGIFGADISRLILNKLTIN